MSGGRAALALLLAWPGPARAQSGGFIARLGTDTMQVEHFTRSGNRLQGTIVTRSPVTRITRWSAVLTAGGTLASYRVATANADGSPLAGGVDSAAFAWHGDSAVRTVTAGGVASQQRMALPAGTVIGPTLPYLGVSYLMYELGFRAARAAAPDSTGTWRLPSITTMARQVSASGTRIWFVGADSAEMDYFGVARSGWRFAPNGDLLRADWSGTTYRYRVERIAPADVERLAATWAAADARGQRMGALSPRDSVRGTIQGVEFTIDYSRPSRRGRAIWGDVVPWDRVWRLGADMATHVTLSAPARIGGVEVAAGRYTLWLLPSAGGTAQLIVNRQVNVFGTNYDPRQDLVRIPLERGALDPQVERLTIAVENDRLWIRWGDASWSVVVSRP